jgi:hypothetical protein
MKPKMPPAKFVKKAAPKKSEEKTESKKERAAEKKNPKLEEGEKKRVPKITEKGQPRDVKVKKVGKVAPTGKQQNDLPSLNPKDESTKFQASQDADTMHRYAELVSDKTRHGNAKAHIADKAAKIQTLIGGGM